MAQNLSMRAISPVSSADGLPRKRLLRQKTLDVSPSHEDVSFLKEEDLHLDECRVSLKTQQQHRSVIVNVSGRKVETCICTLERHPDTILGNTEKRRKLWDPRRKEFFIDAHPTCFEAIYQYFQTDKIKKPYEVPLQTFLEQLEFFEIDRHTIDLYKNQEGILCDEPEELPEGSTVRKTIWRIFEYPSSSRSAQVLALVSISFVILSLYIMCFETLPEHQDSDCKKIYEFNYKTGNVTVHRVPNYESEFFLLETVCVFYFSLEYLLRICCCPNVKVFLLKIMNNIDLLSIIPYFTNLTITLATNNCEVSKRSTVLLVMRILRVARVFKLSKHSKTLQIWAEALKASINEFIMFLFFLLISGILFASLLYISEQYDPESQIRNIPEGIYWGVATMTTVGYGDVVPTSFWGKITGGACVISGVIAVALPTPIIISNFNRFYRNVTGRGQNTENHKRR